MKTHRQILGLPENATTAQIKKAYREKAKALHPDVNKEPGAADKFIEVTEAYLHLTGRKSSLIKKISPTRKRNMSDEEAREAYRAKARRNAQMRYEEWLKSEEYQLENAIGIFAMHLAILLGGLFILGCSIYFLTQKGGMGSVILMLLVMGPIYISILKNADPLGFDIFFESVMVLSRHYTAFSFFGTAASVFLFLKFALATMIPIWIMLVLYIIIPIAVIYGLRKNKRINKITIATSFVPFAMGLLLTINYYISFAPKTETYTYTSVYDNSNNKPVYMQIVLDGDVYSDYPGIMIFHGGRRPQNYRRINYTFKRGIFGLRVMYDFEFSRVP